MNVYIDTAAFLALLNANDRFHEAARRTWSELLPGEAALFTRNYVLLEMVALLQHHFGIEAVRLFQGDVLPALEFAWVDKAVHNLGVSGLLAANRRNLSLVDCTSFEIMRRFGLETVFTFDPHFREQGFKSLPD